ncbi:MAG: DUF1552 domain-containing protein [Myxococcales bacterium FL481]|nr:MAG: DUF1552 domain-containing protein [Myxococcales bacterium FL481]
MSYSIGESPVIHRRQFLNALGLGATSLVLPSLATSARASGAPRRLLLFYSAQGTVPWRWSTNPEGKPDDAVWTSDMGGWSQTEFSDALQPLYPWRDRVSVVDGLSLLSAEADGDGFRHERAQAHSLTGAKAAWVGGFPYSGAPTLDQIVADVIARQDRYRSLELSVSHGLAYDGYGSVIYQGRNRPLPAIDKPAVLWDRLFGFDPSTADPVTLEQTSMLDAVAQRYAAVAGRLSAEDRRKLEIHRDLVRSLERRITGLATAECDGEPDRPASYGDYDTDLANHTGLIALAFACDLTRVISIQLGQLTTAQLGAPPGDVHAEIAHGIYDDRRAEDLMTEYTRVHARQLADIMAMLDAIPEAGGTVLDSTLIVWLSEMADSWHGFDRYPIVVAGGGGMVKLGQWIHYPRDAAFEGLQYDPHPRMGRPHQPFLTTIARAMGAQLNSMPIESVLGTDGQLIDCTGILPELLP